MSTDANAQIVARVMGRDTTRGTLLHAFERVCGNNWKAPIDATIEVDGDHDMALLTQAVMFFTGSTAVFSGKVGKTWRVRAAGYYAAIGA